MFLNLDKNIFTRFLVLFRLDVNNLVINFFFFLSNSTLDMRGLSSNSQAIKESNDT